MDVKKIAKTAISYGSGYAGLKAGTDTMRDAARIPYNGVRYAARTVKEMREEARLDRELARTMCGKDLWRKMVSDFGMTTESVRSRYKIVVFVNYLLLAAIAVFAGYWYAIDSDAFAVHAACGIYLWVVFLMLFYNAYRGHIAYSKCVTNPFDFLWLVIKNPLQLIVKSLPDNYSVEG